MAGGGEENVQADWTVTDALSDAFILNKPTIPDVVSRANVYAQVKDILVDGANIITTDDDTAHTVSIAGQPGGGEVSLQGMASPPMTSRTCRTSTALRRTAKRLYMTPQTIGWSSPR